MSVGLLVGLELQEHSLFCHGVNTGLWDLKLELCINILVKLLLDNIKGLILNKVPQIETPILEL